ncbi:MAG: hypothetical protein H0V81_02450 [Solirubrobacterales bacterium]|nr:hypothetical protein [Solirubrobacterales bacterium]
MAAYLVALALVVVSVVVGRAVCAACAIGPGSAPPVGLATLIVVAALGVRLPGGAALAAVLIAASVVASGVLLWRRARSITVDTGAFAVAGLAAAVGSVPFWAAGTVGLPGMSLNNDTAVHMLWAEGLRSAEMSRLYPANPGYPLGPHSLLASLATGTGANMDVVLTALVIAIPVLMSLVAFNLLRSGASSWLAAPAALAVAYVYLSAAWFGQAAFKEPTVALLLLGLVATVGPLLRAERIPVRAGAPAGLLTAALLLVYSYLALAWIGLAVVLIVLLTIIRGRRPSWASTTAAARRIVPPLALASAVTLVGILSEIRRIARYANPSGTSTVEVGIPTADLGNLAQPLRKTEALGIWPVADWRFPPADGTFLVEPLLIVLVVCLVLGAVYLVLRGQPELPGALAAAALIAQVSAGQQSPYVTAKALAILSPFVALVLFRALLLRPVASSERASTLYGGRVVLAAGLLLAGGLSSIMVLRFSPVESPAQRDQLGQLRPLLDDGPALLLVQDDYAGWRLRGLPVAYPGVGFPSPISVTGRPTKPLTPGQPVDWDSVEPKTLDRFAYVVTTASDAQSAPPPNFRLIGRTALYEAWKRTGPTPPQRIIEGAGTASAPLDCNSPQGRRLRRSAGTATVLARPPVVVATNLPPLSPGVATPVTLDLPAGRWELSMRYASQVPLRLQIGTRSVPVPANTTRLAALWPVARVRSTGVPQPLLVIAEKESRLTPGFIASSVAELVAVLDVPEQRVRLRGACGRSVDHYVLDAPTR